MNAAEVREALSWFDDNAEYSATLRDVSPLADAARAWLAVLETNPPTLSSLFIVCSHGRRSAHTVSPLIYPQWCPGGRPATLEDLEGEVIEWCLQHRQPLIANGTCNLIELDGEPCRIVERILIPLPQMVAGESL